MAEAAWMIAKVLGLVVLDLVLLAGLVAVPLGLSGNFIILGAALVVAFVTRFGPVGIPALLVMAAFVAVGEILEALLGSVVARRYGATRWGMIGAFVGGLLGAVVGTAFFPLIGTVIGSFLGTAVCAFLAEAARGAQGAEGTRAGWGALLGKTIASALKLAIGVGMAVYVVYRTHQF